MRLPSTGRRANQRSETNAKDGGTLSNYIPQLPPTLAQAYKAFNATLTKEQRASLNIHSEANPTGEIKPLHKEDECARMDMIDCPKRGPNQNAWLSALSTTDTLEPDTPTPSGYLHIIAVLSILRRVLRVYEVSGQQEPAVRLHGECIALALGIPGYRQAEVARTYGVTKQAVNKRVRVIAQALELPPAYRTPLASLPRRANLSLKGSTHPHPSKPSHKAARGQRTHKQLTNPTPSSKTGG